MKKFFFQFIVLLSFAFLSQSFNQILANQLPKFTPDFDNLVPDEDYIDGQLLIKYKYKPTVQELGAEIIGEIDSIDAILIVSSNSTEELYEKHKNQNYAEFVEPNYIYKTNFTPNDSYFNQMWHMQKVEIEKAYDEAQNGEKADVVVAVIDTGVDYTHPDLKNNMWDGSNSCKDYNGKDISNGCPHHGYYHAHSGDKSDSMPKSSLIDPMGREISLHGSHCGGTIGAVVNNSTGVAGYSEDSNIKLMSLNNDMSLVGLLRSIYFAENNNADIINASWSGVGSSFLYEAIYNFNGLFIAAAGNARKNHDMLSVYPCDYDINNIICVAATDPNDRLASFSDYGKQKVHLGAPGVSILSTINSNNASKNTLYMNLDGTSMATPNTVGVAAMIWSYKRDLGFLQVKDIVINSGDSLSDLANTTISGKRINAYNALLEADKTTPQASPTRPPLQNSGGGTGGNNPGGGGGTNPIQQIIQQLIQFSSGKVNPPQPGPNPPSSSSSSSSSSSVNSSSSSQSSSSSSQNPITECKGNEGQTSFITEYRIVNSEHTTIKFELNGDDDFSRTLSIKDKDLDEIIFTGKHNDEYCTEIINNSYPDDLNIILEIDVNDENDDKWSYEICSNSNCANNNSQGNANITIGKQKPKLNSLAVPHALWDQPFSPDLLSYNLNYDSDNALIIRPTRENSNDRMTTYYPKNLKSAQASKRQALIKVIDGNDDSNYQIYTLNFDQVDKDLETQNYWESEMWYF